jgi:methionyl-tRNA formyltransferase
MPLRIVFMGTPDFSVPVLSELVGQGHEVAAAYTRAPRPAGRGMAERRSPVHDMAAGFGIPVFTPRSLKGADQQAAFAAHAPDAVVVVAYGLILPQAILEVPELGCWNLHASLLPRWRGAAPIERAIMAGDRETGVMVMRMEAGLDTGPVAMAERVPIEPTATAGELTTRLSRLGADLMVRAMAALSRGGLDPVPQGEDGVTYAAKLEKNETRIDWTQPADVVRAKINGLSPFPGAWCEIGFGGKAERVKLLRAAPAEGAGAAGTVLTDDLVVAAGGGALRLLELQRAGGKPLAADVFQRGAQLKAGTVLA